MPTALLVFLPDVPKFPNVVDFKLAWTVRLVTAPFTVVGVEPVENAMPERKGDGHHALRGKPLLGLVLLPERFVEVGQGFVAFVGLGRDPNNLRVPVFCFSLTSTP
jgi:hypothetical protein